MKGSGLAYFLLTAPKRWRMSVEYSRAKATPYPLNRTGQNLTFAIFDKRGTGDGV